MPDLLNQLQLCFSIFFSFPDWNGLSCMLSDQFIQYFLIGLGPVLHNLNLFSLFGRVSVLNRASLG